MSDTGAVLVTGCSSGIGRASARALARAGLPTWATARRPETLGDLEAAGCRVLQLDVTDEASRVRAVQTVEAEHGAVGAVVNNAGYPQVGPLEEVSLQAMQRQFDTNVFGLLRMCQLVLPGMRAQHSGTIVNIGSVGGLLTAPVGGPYHMTKYALEALSDALRYEVRGFGVRVVLLQPDGVLTRFPTSGTATMPGSGTPGPYDTLKKSYEHMITKSYRQGARGMLTPEDVATVVVKAITSPHPKTRYKIGLRARLVPPMRRAVGDRMWDTFMARQFPTD
jgi:NADP-dependent 3-hydroxy acid dehydrogenase YdfG